MSPLWGLHVSPPIFHRDVVRHWFSTVKIFPGITSLLRVVAPGALVCVARGGNLTAELAYGNHRSVVPQVADVHGRALVFDLRCVTDSLGLRLSPLVVVLKPKLNIIHDPTFARAGGRSAVNGDTVFSSACCCGSATCLVMCCYECYS